MTGKDKNKSKSFSMMLSVLLRGMKSFRFLGAVLAVGVLEVMDVLPIYLDDVYVVDGVKYVNEDILNLCVFGGYTLFQLMAVSVSMLPFGFLYCEDKKNHMLQMVLQRSSTTQYSFVHMMAAGIGSFLTVLGGELLFVITYLLLDIPLSSRRIDSCAGENGFSLLDGGHYIQLLMAFLLLRCLRGAFFGLLSMLLSTYLKNKWVIASMPIILYYFLMRFGYGQLNLPGHLNIRGIYWMFVLGDNREWLSIAYTASMTLGVMVLFSFWMEHKIRRSA